MKKCSYYSSCCNLALDISQLAILQLLTILKGPFTGLYKEQINGIQAVCVAGNGSANGEIGRAHV